MSDPVREQPPLTVLYDGACPLCRREIDVYRGLQPNTPVCFADVSDGAPVSLLSALAAGAATLGVPAGPTRRTPLISPPSPSEHTP